MKKKSQGKKKHNSKPLARKVIVQNKSYFKILLTGAVMGAIGTILFALKSGHKTGQRLAKHIQSAGRLFGDLGRGFAEQIRKVADRGYARRIDWRSSQGRTAMVSAGILTAVASTLFFAPRSKEAGLGLTKQMRTGRDRFKEAVEKVQSDAQKMTPRVRDTVKVGVQPNGDMAPRMIKATRSEIYRHVR